ncbi:MAG: GPP34 family phosphoprotein [Ekhidna sp.]|nr:GPP34 family phosphoprotein [Ekhidna sp.]MBC6409261.1 GPP34 family phosphoprotein [Ekhidna sp.]MBC6427054.1 GPP34 family phosphoprotein [Ekhidna sp.]
MKLSIAEAYYLIALDDEEGRILAAAERTVVPSVISACILELYLLKKISLHGGIVKVLDTVGTGNGILDNVLKKLKNGVQIVDQVKALSAKFKDIEVDLNALLVQRGILKKEETKLLWIPLSERMENANYAFEQNIRNALKAIVFKSAKPSPPLTILFCLIDYTNILDEVFRDRDELIDAEKVGKEITDKAGISDALATSLNSLKGFLG